MAPNAAAADPVPNKDTSDPVPDKFSENAAEGGDVTKLDSKKPSATGVNVTYTGLTYSVPVKKKDPLVILQKLDGFFETRRLTALMGPSGSGKTTLMDILAGRKTEAGKVEGEILYGGSVAPVGALKHLCGYVEQFDTLIGELTVNQMLMYTAEMKLPLSMRYNAKKERVNDIIAKLRLEKCRDTVIGNVLKRGISGGQAKRVNIALALITRPMVMFLDEPTSGLDSKMANEVCILLKELARDGCTVVATVHSPTSFAFSLFDDLTMLHAGGKVVYSGEVANVRQHFESSCGVSFPQDQGYSLPDWLVDMTSGALGGASSSDIDADAENGTAATDFGTVWSNSEACKVYHETHQKVVSESKGAPQDLKALPTTGPGQLKALRTLLAYRMSTHYRSGEFLGPRFGDKIFMSVLTMTLYWGIGDKKDAQSIQSTAAVLYFFCALCGYGAAAFVPSLTLERSLFYRERADGCYTAVTYYLSKFIEEAVLCTVTSLVFTLIVFWAMSLQGSFIFFALTYFLTSMLGIVLAYAVAAVAPNMEAANALLPTYVTTCMYFGGLFLVFDKIPTVWYWYSWTSFLRYAWGALMLNQFADEETGIAKVFYDDGERMSVLEFYKLDEGIMSSISGCLGILGGLCILFGFLGAMGLTYVSHVKR
jgi:ABC-type multidrug transport system ATPase subunit